MRALHLIAVAAFLVEPVARASANDAAGSKSAIPLDVAAEKSCDYLIQNCTCQPPQADFWKNPNDAGVGADQNGWQGAQGLQSVMINYECTGDPRYLKVIQDFADWTIHTYSGKQNLTLCETWPDFDFKKNKGVGQSAPHYCMWDDDAGWVMNLYLQFYRYTHQDRFLDAAYQTLLNGDQRWGVDFQDHSRGLRYKDHEDHFPIYMSTQLIAALGISDTLRTAGDAKRAGAAFALACQYDNFIENYLHSTGRGQRNITGNAFGMPRDCYQIAAHFGKGPNEIPADTKCSRLDRGYFTATHMMMAAAYVMFDRAQENGADVGLLDPRFRNFHERARLAADAFVTLHPNGYAEPAASGRGTVFIDACDPNVNGFGCYWWVKYVVPLDPARYGGVVIRTAREIIADQGTGDLSKSLWNTPPSRPGTTAPLTHSVHATAGDWVMVRDASACTIIAAANWIQKIHHLDPDTGDALPLQSPEL